MDSTASANCSATLRTVKGGPAAWAAAAPRGTVSHTLQP